MERETGIEQRRRAELDMAARKVKGVSDHTVVWAELKKCSILNQAFSSALSRFLTGAAVPEPE
jgi:hypothetical protein